MIEVTVTRCPFVPRKIRKPEGRPKFLDLGASFEIWFQVEEQKRRADSSANKACKTVRLTGYLVGRGGPKEMKTIAKGTLRRIYQEVCRRLKAEQAEYDLLRNVQAPASREQLYADELCPTVRWFHDERERRLAV